MAQRLNIRVPYMVMEGIAPDDSEPAASGIAEKYSGEKYVLYTGTLNYSFGIGTLLEAFSYIPDESLKLIICGFGEAEAAISEMTEKRRLHSSEALPCWSIRDRITRSLQGIASLQRQWSILRRESR